MPKPSKTALVTGATGGIGRELCRMFARHGFDLIITARSRQELDRLAARLRRAYGIQVQTIPADLTCPDAPRQIYDQVGMSGARVDLLANNAGFGLGGWFSENEPATQTAMLQVNVAAPTRLIRLFLPDMLARGSGAILSVASTGSFAPGPMNAVYCASKAYLLHLSEALAVETAGKGVRVCAVCPGATHTGFAHRADMETTRLFRYGVLSPRQVAEEAWQALAENKPVTAVGRMNKALVFAMRIAPRQVVAKLSGAIQRPAAASSRPEKNG